MSCFPLEDPPPYPVEECINSTEVMPSSTNECGEYVNIRNSQPITFTVNLSDVYCELSDEDNVKDTKLNECVTENIYAEEKYIRTFQMPRSKSSPAYTRLRDGIDTPISNIGETTDRRLTAVVDPKMYFITNYHVDS